MWSSAKSKFQGEKTAAPFSCSFFFHSPIQEKQLNCGNFLQLLEQKLFKLFAITEIDALRFLLLEFTCQVQDGVFDPIIILIMQQASQWQSGNLKGQAPGLSSRTMVCV